MSNNKIEERAVENIVLNTMVAGGGRTSIVSTTEQGISFKIVPHKIRGFEIVEKYNDQLGEDHIPQRGTEKSGGFDLKCAEDTIVPSLVKKMAMMDKVMGFERYDELFNQPHTIEETGALLKEFGLKPTLVPTGVKAYFPSHQTLDIQSRSGMPLKTLLIIANAPGLIDADYYNNENNEGHIFVQFINLSPFDILIKKGEKMAQCVFRDYYITDNDQATAKRVGGFASTGI